MCSPGVALNTSSAKSDGRIRLTPFSPAGLGQCNLPVDDHVWAALNSRDNHVNALGCTIERLGVL